MHGHMKVKFTWSVFVVENLTVSHIVKIFFAFCGTPKVYYRVHNSPTPCSVLSQMNQIRVLQPHCFIIHVNIHPSMVRSSKWSLSFNLSTKNYLRLLPGRNTLRKKKLCQSYFLFSVRCSVLGSETIVRFAVCFLSLLAYVSWNYFGLGMAGSFHILSCSLLTNHRNTGSYSQGY